MQVITSVTQKGQITLPKKIRNAVGIKPYTKIKLEVDKNIIKIKPQFDILDIAGTLKPVNKKPVLNAREKFEKNYTRS